MGRWGKVVVGPDRATIAVVVRRRSLDAEHRNIADIIGATAAAAASLPC